MPAVPKKKMSRTRSLKRKGSIKVSLPNLSVCPKCKKPKLPHVVCAHCGYYQDKKVLDKTAKTKTKVIREPEEKKVEG